MSKPSDDGPTHGPWRACLDHNGRHEVRGAGSYTVATVFHTPDGRVAANADLISAAPDLLEALKELDAVLGDTPMPDCGTMNRLITASSNARAAIAKAVQQ